MSHDNNATLSMTEPLEENQPAGEHDRFLLLVHAKDEMILQQQHTIACLENELERLNVYRKSLTDAQQLWAEQHTTLILERDAALHRAEQLEWELQSVQNTHKGCATVESQLRMEVAQLQSMLGQHAHTINEVTLHAEHARQSAEERIRMAEKSVMLLGQRLQAAERKAKARSASRVASFTDSDGTSPEAFQLEPFADLSGSVDGDGKPLKDHSDDEVRLCDLSPVFDFSSPSQHGSPSSTHSPYRISSPVKHTYDSRLVTLFSYFDDEGGSLDLDGLRSHGLQTLLAMQQALKIHNARDTDVRTFRKRERIRKALSGQIGRLRGQR